MGRRQLSDAGRFLIVGGANTLLGLSVIYAAKGLGQFGDVSANVLGYSAGLVLSFTLNRRWTFAHFGPRLPALARFLFVALAAYGLNLATVMIAISHFGVNSYIAQALGITPYTLTSYFGSKHFAFRK